MLSVAKLYAGQQLYYEDAVARGLEDYYRGIGEAPGRWIGRGSELLGLLGVADAAGLDAILGGRDPRSGTRLTDGEAPKIIGYDATFCAPKSVSLLFALGPAEVATEVRAAHDAAVSAALRAYEDVACRARRGHGGATVLEADGFVATAFQHRSSRAGDPHLHTHVLIAHPVHADVDNRWSAIDGRRLFPWAKPVGHLYEAQLRAELTRRLGVEWGPVRNGIADMPPCRVRCCGHSPSGEPRSRPTSRTVGRRRRAPRSSLHTRPGVRRIETRTRRICSRAGDNERGRWA